MADINKINSSLAYRFSDRATILLPGLPSGITVGDGTMVEPLIERVNTDLSFPSGGSGDSFPRDLTSTDVTNANDPSGPIFLDSNGDLLGLSIVPRSDTYSNLKIIVGENGEVAIPTDRKDVVIIYDGSTTGGRDFVATNSTIEATYSVIFKGSAASADVLGETATLAGVTGAQNAAYTNATNFYLPSIALTAVDDTATTVKSSVSGGSSKYIMGKNIKMKAIAYFARVGSNAAGRFWLAFANTTPSLMLDAADPASAKIVGWRYSPVDGDTHIMAICKDGTTITASDTGITPPTIESSSVQWLRLEIECDDTAGAVYFRANDALVATITTHRPALGTILRYIGAVAAPANTGDATLFISQIKLRQDAF